MLQFLFEAGKQLLKTMMAHEWYIRFHMFCITKRYIQAIFSTKKSDQHSSSVSLFLNTSCSSALICMSVPSVLDGSYKEIKMEIACNCIYAKLL